MLIASNSNTPKSLPSKYSKRGTGFAKIVNGPVLDVLRDETRRCDDCQQRTEDRHRSERNVFQDLEFLLKSESRHENGAADKEQCENQKNVKSFLAGEFGQRVNADRENPCRRKSAMQSLAHFNKRGVRQIHEMTQEVQSPIKYLASFGVVSG